jgi:RNA polymerase nonessential primary-like sigma factor
MKDTSTLQLYLQALRHAPLLTKNEEQQLAYAIKQGDVNAKHRLITANLRLVVTLAKNFLGAGFNLEDLIEEGNLGLIKAVEKFDPAYACRFATHARWWIEQAIREGIMQKASLIRLPAHIMRRHHLLFEHLDAITLIPLTPQTLEQSNNEDADPQLEQARHLQTHLQQLTPVMQEVLGRHFGLAPYPKETLQTIAEHLQLSRSRVRQLQNEGLQLLKQRLQ